MILSILEICKCGTNVVGCNCIDENGNTGFITHKHLSELVKDGLVENAKFSNGRLRLIDSSNIKRIQVSKQFIQDVNRSIRNRRNIKDNSISNMDRAKKYVAKARMIGIDIQIDIISEDCIILVKVPDGTGTFIVPDFITDIAGCRIVNAGTEDEHCETGWNPYSFVDSNKNILHEDLPPFYGTHYSKIVVEGKRMKYYCGLCSGVMSERLEVVIEESGTKKYFQYMFCGCKNLVSLDISGIDFSSAKTISGMFGSCYNLKHIEGDYLNSQNIEDISYLFYRCKGLDCVSLHSSGKGITNTTSLFESAEIGNIDLSGLTFSRHVECNDMFRDTMCESVNLSANFKGSEIQRFSGLYSFEFQHVKNIILPALDIAEAFKIVFEMIFYSEDTSAIFGDQDLKVNIGALMRRSTNGVFESGDFSYRHGCLCSIDFSKSIKSRVANISDVIEIIQVIMMWMHNVSSYDHEVRTIILPWWINKYSEELKRFAESCNVNCKIQMFDPSKSLNRDTVEAYKYAQENNGATIIINNDNDIELVKVPDGYGEFTIPDFITSIRVAKTSTGLAGPFYGTHYSKIKLGKGLTSFKALCSGMESKEIEVYGDIGDRYSLDFQCIFQSCKNATKIAIDNIQYKIIGWPSRVKGNIASINFVKAFADCINLQNIQLPDSFSLKANEMFANCRSLKHLDLSKIRFTDGGGQMISRKHRGNEGYFFTVGTDGIFMGCKSLSTLVLRDSIVLGTLQLDNPNLEYVKINFFLDFLHLADEEMGYTFVPKLEINQLNMNGASGLYIGDIQTKCMHSKIKQLSISGIINCEGFEYDKESAIMKLREFIIRCNDLEELRMPDYLFYAIKRREIITHAQEHMSDTLSKRGVKLIIVDSES